MRHYWRFWLESAYKTLKRCAGYSLLAVCAAWISIWLLAAPPPSLFYMTVAIVVFLMASSSAFYIFILGPLLDICLLQRTVYRFDVSKADAAEGLFRYRLYQTDGFDWWSPSDFSRNLALARKATSVFHGQRCDQEAHPQ